MHDIQEDFERTGLVRRRGFKKVEEMVSLLSSATSCEDVEEMEPISSWRCAVIGQEAIDAK